MQTKFVAVLLFDDVEVLDFAGPFEVFSVAGRRTDDIPFDVATVSEFGTLVRARNGLEVVPRHSFNNCPDPDILVVPGGFGTRREMHNPVVVQWIREQSQRAELVLSVCTGALLLARAELLDGLTATTHHGAFDLLESIAPHTRVDRTLRVADNGRVILSAGVSADIDMSLHVVARLHGVDYAAETATYMEYAWNRGVQ